MWNLYFFLKKKGVSGTIEKGETPFQTAIREIQEETQLIYKKDINLITYGRPLQVYYLCIFYFISFFLGSFRI